MVDEELIPKLHYMEGWSTRRIHRQLGYARQTIRRTPASAEVPRHEPAELPHVKAASESIPASLELARPSS